MADPTHSNSSGAWRELFVYFSQPKPWVSLSLAAALPIVLAIQVALLMQDLPGLHDSLFILDGGWLLEPWTLASSRFAHKGFIHMRHNLIGLLLLGPIAERLLGWRLFLGFYMLASVVAGIAGIELGADSSVGASGGVFATIGLLVVVLTRVWVTELWDWYKEGMPRSLEGFADVFHSSRPHELTALVVSGHQIWGLVQWHSATPVGQTGNVAHLVGLLLGAGVALWWHRRSSLHEQRPA